MGWVHVPCSASLTMQKREQRRRRPIFLRSNATNCKMASDPYETVRKIAAAKASTRCGRPTARFTRWRRVERGDGIEAAHHAAHGRVDADQCEQQGAYTRRPVVPVDGIEVEPVDQHRRGGARRQPQQWLYERQERGNTA